MRRGAGGRGPGPPLGAPRPLAQPEGKAGLGHNPRLPPGSPLPPQRGKSPFAGGERAARFCCGYLPQRRERSCPDPPRLRFPARGCLCCPQPCTRGPCPACCLPTLLAPSTRSSPVPRWSRGDSKSSSLARGKPQRVGDKPTVLKSSAFGALPCTEWGPTSPLGAGFSCPFCCLAVCPQVRRLCLLLADRFR